MWRISQLTTSFIKASSIPHFIKHLKTNKCFLYMTLLLPVFCFTSAMAISSNNSSTDRLKEFSANDIYFYQPCDPPDRNGNSSSLCGNTPREKYWALLRNTFDEVHAAAIFGSIDHEGFFGPTLWQYEIVPPNSGQFNPQYTWDQLYNCTGPDCAGGVGTFQITWSLGTYLRYINEKNPDLLKYFKDPTYSLYGDPALEKIGATDYDKLVQQEIDFVLNSINQESFKATKTIDEAADWWTTFYENCSNCCGTGDQDHSCEQIAIRRASAHKNYDEMKNYTCSSSSGSTADTTKFTLLDGYGALTFYGPDAASNGGYAGRNATEAINGGNLADGQVAKDSRDGGLLNFGDIIYIETTPDKNAETSHAHGRYFIVADTGGQTFGSNKWDIDVYVDEPIPSKLNYPPYGSTNSNAKIYKVASGVSWDDYLKNYANATNPNAGGSSAPLSGENITWIGDSYSTGAQSIIEKEFPGISFGGSVNDGNSYIQDCKHVAIDTDCLANPTNPSGFKILREIIDKGELKPYLVMALGTNGEWNNQYTEELKNILSSHPDTQVVLVTSRTTLSDFGNSNQVLKQFTDSNSNYYLADWASLYDSSYFVNDPEGEHPSAGGGYEKWVGVIADALREASKNSSASSSGDGICPSGVNDVTNTIGANVGEAAKIPLDERMNWLFPNGVPESESEMQSYLTNIEVPIINESGNQSTLTLTVHKKLAKEIEAIFTEMTKVKNFKIKPDTYGYEWRTMASGTGSMSHHSYGSAIDINPDDNPAAYTEGNYNPGGNPYSVTDEIVKIWKDHGFYWGGDWSSSYVDYMHFTYANH